MGILSKAYFADLHIDMLISPGFRVSSCGLRKFIMDEILGVTVKEHPSCFLHGRAIRYKSSCVWAFRYYPSRKKRAFS
jgi:hypothetical protein